jgi:hypothetical protein
MNDWDPAAGGGATNSPSLRTARACVCAIDAMWTLPIGHNFEGPLRGGEWSTPETSCSQRGQAEYIAANAAPLSLMMREFNPPWRRTHLRT